MRATSVLFVMYVAMSLAILFLQGCGGGIQNSPAPTLTFTGSNLEQYGELIPTNISVIEIKIQENLDPLSVTNANVHLMPGMNHIPTGLDDSTDNQTNLPPLDESPGSADMDAVEGNVWFDATTKTINFVPKRPLSPGVTYHLRVQNITLADGRKIIPKINSDGTETGVIQFSFSTSHVHEILHIRYDKEGNEVAYISFEVEANALKARRQYDKSKQLTYSLEYNTPLPTPSTRIASNVHRNSKGEIVQYNHDIIENGNLLASVRFKDAGVDTFWGTDDDLAVSWTQQSTNNPSHTITKNYTLASLSDSVRWSGINTPGFKLRNIYLEEHAGKNFGHRTIFYRDLGGNGEVDIDPNTQDITVIDDNISLWYKRDFIDGKRTRSWTIDGISTDTAVGGEGLDNQLFTNDDISKGLTAYEYYPKDGSPSSGQLKSIISYYGTGLSFPLNEWLIDEANNIVRTDVPIHSYNRYSYDGFGNRSEDIRYSPGPDGIVSSESELASGLSDDYITRRVIFSTAPTVSGGSSIGLP